MQHSPPSSSSDTCVFLWLDNPWGSVHPTEPSKFKVMAGSPEDLLEFEKERNAVLGRGWKKCDIRKHPITCIGIALKNVQFSRTLLRQFQTAKMTWAVHRLIHGMMVAFGNRIDSKTLDVCFEILSEIKGTELAVMLYLKSANGRELSHGSYHNLLYLLSLRTRVHLRHPDLVSKTRRSQMKRSARSKSGASAALQHIASNSSYSTLRIAVGVFREALEHYSMSKKIYQRMMMVAQSHNKPRIIEYLLVDMYNKDFHPSTAMWCSIMCFYYRIGDKPKGDYIFGLLLHSSQQISFSKLMNAGLPEGEKGIDNLAHITFKLRVMPLDDQRFWESYLHACIYRRRSEELMLAVEAMTDRKLKPSDRMYELMYEHLLSCSLVKAAKLREFQRMGGVVMNPIIEAKVANDLGENFNYI
ncbi:hypothetical protein HDU97_006700 [Phlyctochytrium planicorne]|nr:hypothetical protein HDU97_006700 [Phlyctochytrium planicorne]